MKLIHREFMTQSRAKLYTKNPNMSDKCPICNQEKDTCAPPTCDLLESVFLLLRVVYFVADVLQQHLRGAGCLVAT